MKQRLDYIERQVYICFDGPGGLIIQTSLQTYHEYYKLLGWELLGWATPLPIVKANRQIELSEQRRMI